MNMSDIEKIKPDWTNRRKVIKLSLLYMGALLALLAIASFVVAGFGMFNLYLCIFATTVAACIFLTYICIIGSYVFGSAFETKDFLASLTNIVPDFGKEEKPDNEREERRYEHKYDR